MKEEVKYSLNKFKDALAKLNEGIAIAKDELGKDGVLQRFEFTFELFWKCLKVFLENEGIQCSTPKECLKSAFKIGIIKDEEIFLDMLEDRNKTSHTYNKLESEKIFKRVRTKYATKLEGIKQILEKKIV